MTKDVRGTATWQVVEDYFRGAISPALGTASTGYEPHASPDGDRIAFTGTVMSRLEGLPRPGGFTVEGADVVELTNRSGSARLPRFSPYGTTLSALSDRAQEGVFQLHLLTSDHFGEGRRRPPGGSCSTPPQPRASSRTASLRLTRVAAFLSTHLQG